MRSARLLPISGITSSPWASTHASASVATPTPCSAAIASSRATTSRLRSRFPSWKRGTSRRQSSGLRSSGRRNRPVSSPRERGLYATKAIPSSRASGSMWASGSRCSSEYSLWTAAIGCVAWARRSVAGWARRARRAAPCPPRRGRPSPRPTPRWAPRRRPGAGCRRRRGRPRGARGSRRSRGAGARGSPARLGGHHGLVAAAGDRATHELLVGAAPVRLGRVDERDAEVERPAHRADALRGVRGAVVAGEAHRAEADRPDERPARPSRRCSTDPRLRRRRRPGPAARRRLVGRDLPSPRPASAGRAPAPGR